MPTAKRRGTDAGSGAAAAPTIGQPSVQQSAGWARSGVAGDGSEREEELPVQSTVRTGSSVSAAAPSDKPLKKA